MAGCNSVSTVTRSHTVHHTTQLDPREKSNHIISDTVDRIGWWSFLAFRIFGVRDGPNPSGPEKNHCQWRRWIPIMMFNDFVSTTRSFATRHQHGMENDKKWCEMTRIFQSCLGFDSHTTSFWQSTANCHVSGKALSKTLSGTHPKTNSSTSSTESKMLCTGNCSVEFQSGLSVPRLRIWVIQPMNDAMFARAWCALADFSLQFLEPWQCTASELWYWHGGGELIRKQLQVVNRQSNWFFVDFCAKVSAEILCNNFSHEVPSMVQTDDCWSNGVRARFERMLKDFFNQRPRSQASKKAEPSPFK